MLVKSMLVKNAGQNGKKYTCYKMLIDIWLVKIRLVKIIIAK